MADYFLSQGELFKHPAAFLIGGVLEEHIRKMAIKNGIEVYKETGKFRQIEDINIDLRKNEIYNESERKQITALFSLRNDADHAHWKKYTHERIETMLMEVRRIIRQYPA